MSKIWGAMMLIGLIVGLVSGLGSALADTALAAAGDAVALCLSLLGAYALWMGIMNIAKEARLIDALAKWMRPILSRVFEGVKDGSKAQGFIAMNLAANMLGLGNAATPYGLNAMQELQRYNRQPRIATNAMCMLLIINASSLQLLPTTVIALRAQAGSANPAIIAFPALIATLVATLAAFALAKSLERMKPWKL